VGNFTLPLLTVEGWNVERANVERANAQTFEVTSPFTSAPLLPSPSAPLLPGPSAQTASASDLLYASFLGGSDSDKGRSIAVDTSGNIYVSGETYSTNFPTVNPIQATSGGSRDAFVTKLNAAGSIVYSTYLGGSDQEDGLGIAVDTFGDAYVTGVTYSSNYPTVNAVQATYGGSRDAFVTKFNPTGSALVYSTYLGGASYDIGWGIAVDLDGNAYVTGDTNSSNFPTVNPIQATKGGGRDAFVTKLNATGSTLVYSTYLGGNGDENLDNDADIAVDIDGNAYVTGYTTSTNFPTVNPIQATNGGGRDAFVTKLNSVGSAIIYSTYLGGDGNDVGNDIAVDISGNIYVTGVTSSTNFPIANPVQATNGGSGDAFVTRLNAVGSALVYSTYLGGNDLDQGWSIAVDTDGNAYVTGLTYSTNFPITDLANTNGGGDAFVTKLNVAGSALVYSAYLGGSATDKGASITLDTSRNAYVTGWTSSADFPTTPGAFDTTYNGGTDAFVVKLAVGGGLPPTTYQTANLGSPSSPTNQAVAEPVSVIFGNYTYQHTDISISSRGLPVALERTYNSITPSVTSDGPFGYGWTHSYALTVTEETSTTVLVRNEDGRLDRFTATGGGGGQGPPVVYKPGTTPTPVSVRWADALPTLAANLQSLTPKNLWRSAMNRLNRLVLSFLVAFALLPPAGVAAPTSTDYAKASAAVALLPRSFEGTSTSAEPSRPLLRFSSADTPGTTTRVSVASDGTQGNGDSWHLAISTDGRYVAFESYATNLVSSDTNNSSDVFIHDQITGQTTRVSVASNGMQGNGHSWWPAISADGRYVAFFSDARNLVPGDTNSAYDVFVRDRQTGQTTRISMASNGTQGNGNSMYPSISADGRYVAFSSVASNLVPGDTNGYEDVFIHDQATGRIERVSVASDGTQGNSYSWIPAISADGRYAAFESDASNLVSGDTNGYRDIFVHDRQTGQTTRVSVASDGTQGNGGSANSALSADGCYVAFTSSASNLVPGDTNGDKDVFVHDRATGQIIRVSVASDGTQGNTWSAWPTISADERYVAFYSIADNLVPGDTNNTADIFVHDRQTGRTNRVSIASDSTQGNNWSEVPAISTDGRFVAFASSASNLVPNDTNGNRDIFVHDRGSSELTPYQTANLGSPSSPTNQTVAEPVSVIFGNYTYQHTDLSLPGRGLPVGIERTYNSITPSVTSDGPFGYGWTHAYVLTNTQETTSTVLVKNQDGRLDRFTEANGTYTPPPGTFNTLTKNPDGTFTLVHKDQTRYNFNLQGRLTSIADKNGNTVTLTYTGSDLTQITDSAGRLTTLTCDANHHITQITDPAGRTNTYAYDANGNLLSHTDARGQTTTYAYDAHHRLTSITDANGHTFVQNTYDAEGRVVQQRDVLNNLTTFSYDTATRQTMVTDPLGNQTVYTYDANWRATGETDPLGHTIAYTYDAQNNRLSVTDKNGNTTRYAYDAHGNTTIITATLGYTTTMTYNAQNNLTSRTDALSRVTSYTYDAKSNLLSTTNVSGTTTFAYDALGQMLSTTDANGHTTQFAYDAYGYQTVITDALGNANTFAYDLVGRKLSERDARGNTTIYTYDANNNLFTATDPLGGVTRYSYDNVGNRTAVTDALGHTTTYVYDAKDRLATVTDTLGGVTTYAYDANNNRTQVTDALSHTTVYTYNAISLVVQVANPLGQVTAYGYDGVGNRTVVTDTLGHASHFAYDALHRLVSVTDPLSHTTSYTYDAVGNKTQVSDANGKITSYAYDGLNRLLRVTDALGGVVTYGYDPVGNKTKMTDANGHVTTYQYDAVNRLTRVTDPLAQATVYGYDAVGNKTSLLDAKGQTTTYTYDTLNRLTQITYPGSAVQYAYDAVGNRTTITDTTGTTTYVYDALNRLASVTSPGSSLTVSYTSDAVGNRTRITYPDGQQVTYAYDAANRLTTATDWASRVTSYSYDPVGNLTAVSYPNSTSASYTYDAANRLLQLTNTGPGGTISGFSYTLDKVGNRTQVAEADGDVLTYTYDALYRLTGVSEQMRVDFDNNCAVDVADIQQVASRWRMKSTDPGWDPLYDLDGDGDIDIVDIMQTSARWGETCERATYTYDPMGNRLSMTTPAGAITYTYDVADRLLSTSDGTAFTWDANGNMLSKGTTTYAYDVANRLTQVVSGTTTAQFTYDGDGKRFNKTANGTATHYLYDVNTSLPVVLAETTGGADTLYTYGADLTAMTAPGGAQTYYHYDGLGSVRNLSDGAGAVIASYTYSAFGNLRLLKGSSDNSFQFTGEQTDDETGLLYLRARYYDPSVGRFISRDPVPGMDIIPQTLNRYSYVQNNSPNSADPSGKIAPLIVVGYLVLEAADLTLNVQEMTRAWKDYDRIRQEDHPDPQRLAQAKRKAAEADVKFIADLALPVPFWTDIVGVVSEKVPWGREWRREWWESAVDAWMKWKERGFVGEVQGAMTTRDDYVSGGKCGWK
jgi:RHS repeat-associated protein